MAGYTYREVVYDLWQSLKQNFDDGELTIAQVFYHVTISANRLKYQHLNNEYKDTKDIGGDYLRIYSGIPIQSSATSSNPNQLKNQKYVILPARLIDLPRDGGIKYVTYDHLDPNCCFGPNQVLFTRVTPGFSVQRLYDNPYEKPTEANPYFYAVEDETGTGIRLYLLGLECSSIAKLQIGCYAYTTAQDVKSLDEVIDLPEHLIETLKYNVASLDRFLLAIGGDTVNDGADSTTITQATRSDQLMQQQMNQQFQAQQGGNQ